MILAAYGAVLLALAGYAWLSGLANPLVVLLVGAVGPMVVACGALFAVFIALLIYEGTSSMLTDIIGVITDWRDSSRDKNPQ